MKTIIKMNVTSVQYLETLTLLLMYNYTKVSFCTYCMNAVRHCIFLIGYFLPTSTLVQNNRRKFTAELRVKPGSHANNVYKEITDDSIFSLLSGLWIQDLSYIQYLLYLKVITECFAVYGSALTYWNTHNVSYLCFVHQSLTEAQSSITQFHN